MSSSNAIIGMGNVGRLRMERLSVAKYQLNIRVFIMIPYEQNPE